MDPTGPSQVTIHVAKSAGPSAPVTQPCSGHSEGSSASQTQQKTQQSAQGALLALPSPAAAPINPIAPQTPQITPIVDLSYQRAYAYLNGQGDVQKEAKRLRDADAFFDSLKIPQKYRCYYREEAEERRGRRQSHFSLPECFVWASKSLLGRYCLWERAKENFSVYNNETFTPAWEYQRHCIQNDKDYYDARVFFADCTLNPESRKARASALSMHAIHTNNPRLLEVCCEYGANINQQDDHGFTPLMLAVSIPFNDTQVLDILLNFGARVHAVDDKGMTALEYLKENRETLGTQIFDRKKSLLLRRTCYARPEEYEIASEELRNWMKAHKGEGFDANDTSYRLHDVCRVMYNHILHTLSSKRSYSETMEYQLPQFAQSELANHALTFRDIMEILAFVQYPCMPLQEAEDQVKGKLAEGRDIINYSTPLSLAALHANEKMVNLLLKAGADTELFNSATCYPPLVNAIQQDLPEGHKSVKALLAYGANINYQDPRSHTPLMLAIKRGNEKMVQLLLAHPRINTEIRDSGGRTALIYSCKGYCGLASDYEMVKLLLDKHVDVTVKDENGNTALMLAIGYFIEKEYGKENYLQLIKLLFSYFSEHAPEALEIQNNQGETARSLAMKSGNQEIVNLFLVA